MTYSIRSRMLPLFLVAVAVPLAGCDDDTTSPAMNDFAVQESDMSARADMAAADMVDVSDGSVTPNDDLALGPDMRPEPGSCAAAGNVQLCEDFESGSVGAAWTKDVSANATMAVEGGTVYNGSKALHYHHNALAVNDTVVTRLRESMTFNATLQPDIYVRAFYYIPVQVPNTAFLESFHAGTADFVFNANGVNAGHLAEYNPGNGMYLEDPAVVLTPGQWNCVEWHVKQDPTNGILQVFVNGNEVTGITIPGQTTVAGGPISEAAVGVSFFVADTMNTHPAADYYIDNIIVDSAPIGCNK